MTITSEPVEPPIQLNDSPSVRENLIVIAGGGGVGIIGSRATIDLFLEPPSTLSQRLVATAVGAVAGGGAGYGIAKFCEWQNSAKFSRRAFARLLSKGVAIGAAAAFALGISRFSRTDKDYKETERAKDRVAELFTTSLREQKVEAGDLDGLTDVVRDHEDMTIDVLDNGRTLVVMTHEALTDDALERIQNAFPESKILSSVCISNQPVPTDFCAAR